MMRRHFGDLGHVRQTDVSTSVRVDVFDHPGETFVSDIGPFRLLPCCTRTPYPEKIGQMFRRWSILPI
jgi:hypothetical protein